MSNLLNEVNATDMHKQLEALADRVALEKERPGSLEIAVSPAVGSCVATYSASVLVNAKGTDLSGRKNLTIRNTSWDTIVLLGTSSTNEIYESGYQLMPGMSVTIKFTDSSYPVYARARGRSVTLEVEES